MSDITSPEGQIVNIPERSPILQNLDFYRKTFEPEMQKDLAQGFVTNSASLGTINRSEAGACLRGKDTEYTNVTSTTTYDIDPGKRLESTRTIITEKKTLPNGEKIVRGFEFFRGPGKKGEEPAMIALVDSDPTFTPEKSQKAIKEVMDGYLAADVYQPDNEAIVAELRRNTMIPQMKSRNT